MPRNAKKTEVSKDEEAIMNLPMRRVTITIDELPEWIRDHMGSAYHTSDITVTSWNLIETDNIFPHCTLGFTVVPTPVKEESEAAKE